MESTDIDLIEKEELENQQPVSSLRGHPYLDRARKMIYVNKLDEAKTLCDLFACEHPESAENFLLLSAIASHSHQLDKAIEYDFEYLERVPDDYKLRVNLIQKLKQNSCLDKALEQVELLRKVNPVLYVSLKADLLQDSGDFKQALSLYRKLIKVQPRSPSGYTHAARILSSIGRVDDATKSYKQALNIQPGLGSVYFAMANTKSYKFSDDEVSEMQRLLELVNLNWRDYFSICYALGKSFEDEGDYDKSFYYYQEANNTKSGHEPYDPNQLEMFHKEQKNTFTQAFFEERKGWGCQASDPIFIVGLPRSGTTLLEQILSSHPEVDACGELSDIIQIAMSFAKPGRRYDQANSGYIDGLKNMTREQAFTLGEKYLQKVRFRRNKAPYFIDKMPNNFHCIALVKLILPNAKIIDARRDPMSVGLANYRQSFPSGLRFTNKLENIGRYYTSYVGLLTHFHQVTPSFVYHSSYENLVQNSETHIRSLLDYCQLKFNKKCLNFHKNKRSIRTPSAAQVSQPMYTSGLDKWKKYQKHLTPLAIGLQQGLDILEAQK